VPTGTPGQLPARDEVLFFSKTSSSASSEESNASSAIPEHLEDPNRTPPLGLTTSPPTGERINTLTKPLSAQPTCGNTLKSESTCDPHT
jgi:hypothetical protein